METAEDMLGKFRKIKKLCLYILRDDDGECQIRSSLKRNTRYYQLQP